MKRRLIKLLATILIGVAILAIGIGIYLEQPKFGSLPQGERLERIESSPNYIDGKFENLVPTPQLIEGNTYFVSATLKYLFNKKERPAPIDAVPSVKTSLLNLDKNKDVVIWLGHSSHFIKLAGKNILVDPVFSPSAAPVSFANKAFKGTNPYTAEDMPEIDYLLITHDHWDHLDYPTVVALKPKIKNVICGLGVGLYFEQWGFAKDIIHEADWFVTMEMDNDFTVHVLPARHYSGRMLTRNKTLWTGFALITQQRSIFISGDSGYGPHFKKIGETLNGFDLVILDSGQYGENWPYIHMTPEEAAHAAVDLKTKALLPAHVGKFSIANHPWDEPFERITNASQDKEYRLLTPIIGETVDLDNEEQSFSRWWESVK